MRNRYRYIMGKNCIREVLKTTPARLVEVYTCQKDSEDELQKLLSKAGVSIQFRPKHALEKMVGTDSHQSYVAAIKEKNQPVLKEFLKKTEEKDQSLVVFLDSIYDPHNIGAILRAAECFGVDLAVFSKNRGGDVTPVASKVSSGGSELIDILKVSNLADALKRFQEAGYFVICADGGEGAVPISEVSFPPKTVILMGSEGEGVQPLLKRLSDERVMIPMHGQIDSLNVSQATAIFFNAYYGSN